MGRVPEKEYPAVSATKGVRTGPLAWGQTWPWLDQFRFPDRRVFQPVGLRVQLPRPGLAIEVVQEAVRRLCERHESLRTRYDVAVDGEPVQYVGDEPALDLDVVRLPADIDDQALERYVAEVIRDAYGPFDLTRSCGRGVLVARGDAVIEILLLFHHVAVDVWGASVLRRDLVAFLGLPAEADTGVGVGGVEAGGQPWEWAAAQATPAAAQRSQAARELWTEQMMTMPHTLFPEMDEGRGTAAHTVHVARMTSSAAAAAVDAIAARHGVSPPAVLLAAYATVLSATTGFTTIGLETIINNRFTAKQRDTATSSVLPAMAIVDVDWNDTLVALAGRCAAALVTAAYRSECDNSERMLDTLRAQHRRGIGFDLLPQFNCLSRSGHEIPPGSTRPPLDAAALALALEETRLEVTDESWWNWVRLTLLYDPDLIEVTLHMTSRARDHDATSDMMRQFESLLVFHAGTPEGTALRDTPVFADVSPPALRDGWLEVDGCRVNPAEVRDLLEQHPEVVRCTLSPFTEAGKTLLHADVVVRTGGPDAVLLHRWLVARLDDHPATIAPARYTVTTDSADADPTAASTDASTADGRGRPDRPRAPRTPGERALLAAVHAWAAPQALLEDAYALTGGRLDRVPAVLLHLEREGWEGLSLEDFLNLRTLADLAVSLRPTASAGPAGAN
ncbi:MAG: hypothetical protein HOV94_18095 [Saccharothrix sp.]|nr:hypothetical protein [Saccharothrix sp.]